MEGSQFDALSRRLGAVRSRRGALRAIAGALVAGIAGTKGAGAQTCVAYYGPCDSDEQCCNGAVCQNGICMSGCRIDGTFVNAWTSPPGDTCNQCLPERSTSTWSPANEGMSCWSGDPDAGAAFCQDGECTATEPASCPPPSPCRTDELLDQATCTYAVAEAGTPCGVDEMCHGGFYQPADTCDGNGFCIGGGSKTVACAPYQCGATACLTSCGSDDDCLSGALCCDGACIDLGTDDHCAACGDVCADGLVCCDGTCAVLGSVDHCTGCGDACLDGQLCDPAIGCVGTECVTASDCGVADICTIGVACEAGVCVVTDEGGMCGTFQLGCGGATCAGGLNACAQTVEGSVACVGSNSIGCRDLPVCTTSDDCGPDAACMVNTCCDTPVCITYCDTAAAEVAPASFRSSAEGNDVTPFGTAVP